MSVFLIQFKYHPPTMRILFTHSAFTNFDPMNYSEPGAGWFVQLHGQRSVSCIYLTAIMCFLNLVQILLIQNNQSTLKSNIPCKLTTGTPLYYSRHEFIEFRQPENHVNLFELTRAIANIRKLRLNKWKFRKIKQRVGFKQTAVDLRNLKQVQSMETDRSEHVKNIRIGMLNARSI